MTQNASYFGGGPSYPSVVVSATGRMDTTLLKAIPGANINNLETMRCGQAATFYELIEGGIRSGRNPPPADACN